MKKTNYARTMLLTLLLSPGLLHASAIVNSSISLTQLQILPSSGTLQFLSPITATAFTEALTSLGELDQQFASADDADATAASLTSLAAANAIGSAPSLTAAVSGHIDSNVPAFASATARGGFSGQFQILGATGPVSLQFIATVMYNQSLSTDSSGLSADSDVTLVLNLDNGDQPLFLNNLLQIGPSSSDSASFSGDITGSSSVTAGDPVFFTFELDTQDHTNDTPEPAAILLTVPALSLLYLRRWLSGPRQRS